MKKIFTLVVVAAGLAGSAFAQSRNENSVAYNNQRIMNERRARPEVFVKTENINYNDARYSYSIKQEEIHGINRELDRKIAPVASDRYLNRRGKSRESKRLQGESKSELSRFQSGLTAHDEKYADNHFGHNEDR